ncbi:DUF937 domain-containing protein [Candidatus Chloroploca sp. M-50]|uniref:DUF937 domain-containing protein n=1 Tax=Candidatus Chloroploca mongolica TaxID=2528176 RepID=A0ABS4DDM0_9CHLR|nr:DUF937 domain-containing protein [Candidatus Chloroploca mongolica]MBP1467544.1 DUF937 domain-containing protein [Candidatus Chloroploca mongolica]
MPSVIDTISNLISPTVIERVGKQVGLSDEMTRQGIALTTAVLAGGLARMGNTPEGVEALDKIIQGADTGVLGNLQGVLGNVTGGTPAVVQQMFGSNLELVTGGIKKATSIDITPFLGLVTPVLMGVIKNMTTQQGMDAAALSKTLQTELRGLSRRDSTTNQVIKEVFKPLEIQDKLRAKFSDEDWATLRQGPIYAATLIILADLSGKGGRDKELDAMYAAIDEAVTKAGPTELLNILFNDDVTADEVEAMVKTHKKSEQAEIQATLLPLVLESVGVARAKAPRSDAVAYQGLMLAVAQHVAAAVKEGGFLGMGGTPVSAEEKAAIDALAAALAAS